TPMIDGTFRCISPAFDTRKVHDMTLSFRHMLDDYVTTTNYTIGVQISTNLAGPWTTLWSVTGSSDIAAAAVSVPVSFELGKSQTTYIAFYFAGNSDDLNYWYIDNVLLLYNDTLGIGNWSAGIYQPVGDVIVPDGYTFHLSGNTTIQFANGTGLFVHGRLWAYGYSYSPVKFTSVSGSRSWMGIKLISVNAANDSTVINNAWIEKSYASGIFVFETDKIRISNCTITDNTNTSGAGISITNSDIMIENNNIYGNEAYSNGNAIYSSGGSPVIKNNQMYQNESTATGSTLYVYGGTGTIIEDNKITNNNFIGGLGYAVNLENCTLSFNHNLIANNSSVGIYCNNTQSDIYNCDIVNNVSNGIQFDSPIQINSSIIYGNGGFEIYNLGEPGFLLVRYSCLESYVVGGNGPAVNSFQYCITSNPLFSGPTVGSGTGYNALTADWTLQTNSPCIDAGDYALPSDPDLSRADMGMYARALKPLITLATDFTPDQGRQIALQWNRNDLDYSFSPDAVYYIWRLSTTRESADIFISDPSQLTPDLLSDHRTIGWRDLERTWTFLTWVPAVNYADYEVIVPTVQDSSATGTHACSFMVMYHNDSGNWESVPLDGYSVDNIPPYAPSRLEISNLGANTIQLDWEEVTEGVWEGNSYPETNLITYKIYGSDTPYFMSAPENYLQSTTNPFVVISDQTAARRFYRIIASDSEF
ncbi:MAG: right-handed parallel beta-helix repeat-containing protein, partial [Candidatus Cloacimonadaceae bacterium]